MQALNITIRRGETVNLPIRVESDTVVYKSISAVQQSAPARLTVTGHGLTTGWRAGVMNVKGMTELNAVLGSDNLPKESELRRVTVVDPNTVEFNAVNAAGFKAYVSGGQLVYYAPRDLSLYLSARMQVKNKVGGTVLLQLTSVANELQIDTVNNALWLRLTDEATALLTFTRGVFDIELLDGAGNVFPLCSADSVLTILPEVTTL